MCCSDGSSRKYVSADTYFWQVMIYFDGRPVKQKLATAIVVILIIHVNHLVYKMLKMLKNVTFPRVPGHVSK